MNCILKTQSTLYTQISHIDIDRLMCVSIILQFWFYCWYKAQQKESICSVFLITRVTRYALSRFGVILFITNHWRSLVLHLDEKHAYLKSQRIIQKVFDWLSAFIITPTEEHWGSVFFGRSLEVYRNVICSWKLILNSLTL